MQSVAGINTTKQMLFSKEAKDYFSHHETTPMK